jgi:hypothetical protein
MSEQYWLVLPNGGRQRIDPNQFDLTALAEQARRVGGRLIVEGCGSAPILAPAVPSRGFEPPSSALGAIFQGRLNRIYSCQIAFTIDMNSRPTVRVLGGYYRKRRLIRIYTHDRETGKRPTEDLFDTFLHEVAHHIEYTEPHSFQADACGRVPGRMHSSLFWRILGELKGRWADLQRGEGEGRTEQRSRV